MKRAMTTLVVASLLAGTGSSARALEPYEKFDRGITIVDNDKLGLDIWGRGQMIGVGEIVADPYAGHERVYEFLKQARLGFDGKYDDLFNYQIEFAYGGENQNTSQSSAGGYELMDYVADVPVKSLGENTILKLGQFRVPYGREALGDEGYQQFADRSIANLATNHGRDFGLALMGTKGSWTGTIGTFPDGGRDIAQRYLPETMGIPEVVARVGYNDGVDADIYHVMGTDRKLTRDTKAFYLNGLYESDTRIGHSTALMSHVNDSNLLEGTAYNPYINRADIPNLAGSKTGICSATSCERGSLFNLGGDAVYRHPMSGGQAVEFEGQADWGGYQNRFGVLHIASARGQADYQVGKWEFAARYAVLSMDSKAGFLSTTHSPNGTQVPGTTNSGTAPAAYDYTPGMGKPIHEIDPSITYHFRNHTMKLVADLPVYLDAPLFIDHTDGAYVFADQGGASPGWNEDSVLTTAGNSMVRRTTVEGRMLFQFQF